MESGQLNELFQLFLEAYYEEYTENGLVVLPDDFAINDPVLETKIFMYVEIYGYDAKFMMNAMKAFQIVYPEGDVPSPPYNS